MLAGNFLQVNSRWLYLTYFKYQMANKIIILYDVLKTKIGKSTIYFCYYQFACT